MRNDAIQINIESILNATLTSQREIQLIQASKTPTILVIGPTGAGKSTLINYLSGVKLLLEKDAIGKNKYSVETSENSGSYAPIGHDGSMTSQPQFFLSSNKDYYLADTAGLLDTRYTESRIKAALSISLMAKLLPIKGLLLVINLDTIAGGRSGIVDDFFKALEPFFKTTDQIDQSIQLVISNKDPDISGDQVQQLLKNLLLRFKSDNKYTAIIQCFLDGGDNLKNVLVFDSIECTLPQSIDTYYSHSPNIHFTSSPALLEESTRDRLSHYFFEHEHTLGKLLTTYEVLSTQLMKSKSDLMEQQLRLTEFQHQHDHTIASIATLSELYTTQSAEADTIDKTLLTCKSNIAELQLTNQSIIWQLKTMQSNNAEVVQQWNLSKHSPNGGLYQFQFSGYYEYDLYASHCTAGAFSFAKTPYVFNQKKWFSATFEVMAHPGQVISATVLLLNKVKQPSVSLMSLRTTELEQAFRTTMRLEEDRRTALQMSQSTLFNMLLSKFKIGQINDQRNVAQKSVGEFSLSVASHEKTCESKQSAVDQCKTDIAKCKTAFTLFHELPTGTVTAAVSDAVNEQLERYNKIISVG